MRSVAIVLTIATAALLTAPAVAAAAAPDDALYAPWERVLSTYVDDEGLVDYAGLKGRGHADLKQFMDLLAKAEPASFATEQQRVAFWINAYNAVVVWQAVENYPIESVRDVGALWGLIGGFFKNKYPIAGGSMSADNIEHDTLRAKFSDARIHWALVCGAFGCPRLVNRPYRADGLDEMLTAQAHEFLRQPRALQLDRDGKTLYLSSYFDWYASDFEAESVTVTDYVLRYAPEDVAEFVRANRDAVRVQIMGYDWALNGQQSGPRSKRPIPRD